jgi:transcription elongation factor GreA
LPGAPHTTRFLPHIDRRPCACNRRCSHRVRRSWRRAARSARIIDPSEADAGAVDVGLQVTVKDLERKRDATYRIVGSAEADPSAGRLSNESPVGRALMGRKKGETVEVVTPRGSKVKFKIMEIKAA